ncbi:hypothetical protein AMELA_G00243590 [Ameiurus melas]|uniref:Uncharacterized protein n=1 Tax=Ameiurus melas TaxID=219545 RepID=A0A7J5ZYR1_AMEME|nr:hypothetical protein AMELA_G00243590 [Ameiurus melas]
MESESQKFAVRKREESGEKKAERRRSRDMQSCSIHHCVLLLLTLTFTTAPVADAVFPIQAKLHQRVTLPCKKECSGEAKWTLYSTRSVVFARCDQTSCSSVVKGYEMSHDQYLKGDLSLTITSAEYSMRNTYVCECRSIDYSVWRLSIETVFSAVQKNPGGRSDPGSVRTRASGGLSKGMTALIVVLLLVLVLVISGVIIYFRRAAVEKLKNDVILFSLSQLAAEEKLREVENEKEAVVVEIKQVLKLLQHTNQRTKLQFNKSTRKMESIEKIPEEVENEMKEVEKKIKEVEKMIGDLEERYSENSKYKEDVGSFCYNKRRDLEVCRNLFNTIQTGSELYDSENLMVMMRMMGGVLDDLENLRRSVSVQSRPSLCTQVYSDLNYIKSRCEKMRDDLQSLKENPSGEANVELKTDTEALVSAVETWCEEKEEELQQYTHHAVSTEHSENQSVELEPLYRNV